MFNSKPTVDALKDAAIWGMTLVLSDGYFRLARETGVRTGRFHFDSVLPTPASAVYGPNVETIYAFAWIDLADGAQVLDVPDTGERYYSLQMIDAYLQTIGYIGSRTTGTAARTFLLTGPGWSGQVPAGMTRFESPTNLLFVLGRMQVCDAQDPVDVGLSMALIDGLVLGPLAGYPEGRSGPLGEPDATSRRFPTLDLAAMGAAYFDRLCDALVGQPPWLADERARLRRFADIGIGPGLQPSRNRELAPYLQVALREAVAEVSSLNPMAPLCGTQWITNTNVRDAGPLDPKLRARMSLYAPGFHCAVEAVYANTANAADGSPLTGDKNYRLHFAPGGIPPVGAFWSITLYAMPGMRLVANPIDRYAIGSNFAALEYGADGSLEILLQGEPPEGNASNWLPTPPGKFMLSCRLYHPNPEVIEGRYSLPDPAEA